MQRRGDRGEGAISTALAVLVMVLLGAAMWMTFEGIWSGGESPEIIDSDDNSGVSG